MQAGAERPERPAFAPVRASSSELGHLRVQPEHLLQSLRIDFEDRREPAEVGDAEIVQVPGRRPDTPGAFQSIGRMDEADEQPGARLHQLQTPGPGSPSAPSFSECPSGEATSSRPWLEGSLLTRDTVLAIGRHGVQGRSSTQMQLSLYSVVVVR
jgi:hypothetical protein